MTLQPTLESLPSRQEVCHKARTAYFPFAVVGLSVAIRASGQNERGAA